MVKMCEKGESKWAKLLSENCSSAKFAHSSAKLYSTKISSLKVFTSSKNCRTKSKDIICIKVK